LFVAREFKPDLIVLDLMMPEMDGWEFIRQHRREQNTPIIILTARVDDTDKIAGLEMGADDYLTKPFAFSELLARLEALMRRRGSYKTQAVLLSVDDLLLNRNTRQVTRGDRPVQLTPKEFALLEYLMVHAETVVSRAHILKEVWGLDADPMTNVVEVYISHLRNKIDKGHTLALIRNVRGFGYRLSIDP
jgi:DNA-binding response OmpR family regulator